MLKIFLLKKTLLTYFLKNLLNLIHFYFRSMIFYQKSLGQEFYLTWKFYARIYLNECNIITKLFHTTYEKEISKKCVKLKIRKISTNKFSLTFKE